MRQVILAFSTLLFTSSLSAEVLIADSEHPSDEVVSEDALVWGKRVLDQQLSKISL